MRRAIHLLLLLSMIGSMLACRDLEERPPLVFSPGQLPQAQVGQPYNVTITVSDNVTPVFRFWVVDGVLPPGLELLFHEAKGSAEISGTPTESGTFNVTIAASCLGTSVNGQTGQQQYELVVSE
jgi:hypothetical protein